MPASFRASYDGIGELLGSEMVGAAMLAHAEKVKARAEATAPYYENDPDGQHYRDRFTARVEHKSTGRSHTPRAVGVVSNDDPAAVYVEFGTHRERADGTIARTPAHHTMRKALLETEV